MVQQFSVNQHRFKSFSDAALRDEIQAHTQNTHETTHILSALARFGMDDASILRFDVIPTASRGFRGATGTIWTVRAFRNRPPVPEPI